MPVVTPSYNCPTPAPTAQSDPPFREPAVPCHLPGDYESPRKLSRRYYSAAPPFWCARLSGSSPRKGSATPSAGSNPDRTCRKRVELYYQQLAAESARRRSSLRQKAFSDQYHGLIFKAAEDGDFVDVEKFMLLDDDLEFKYFLGLRDDKGRNPLHMAAKYGQIRVLANANRSPMFWQIRSNKGYSLLHYAAAGGNIETVEWLLAQADVEKRLEAELFWQSTDGKTPFDLALDTGVTNVARLLDRYMAPLRARRLRRERQQKSLIDREQRMKVVKTREEERNAVKGYAATLITEARAARELMLKQFSDGIVELRKYWIEQYEMQIALWRHDENVRAARKRQREERKEMEEAKRAAKGLLCGREDEQERVVIIRTPEENPADDEGTTIVTMDPSDEGADGGGDLGMRRKQSRKEWRLTLGLEVADKIVYRTLGEIKYDGCRVVKSCEPAASQGIQAKDIVIALDGKHVNSVDDWNQALNDILARSLSANGANLEGKQTGTVEVTFLRNHDNFVFNERTTTTHKAYVVPHFEQTIVYLTDEAKFEVEKRNGHQSARSNTPTLLSTASENRTRRRTPSPKPQTQVPRPPLDTPQVQPSRVRNGYSARVKPSLILRSEDGKLRKLVP